MNKNILETIVSLNQFNKVLDFISTVNKYDCQIDASQDRYIVDGHSILGLYSLNLINPVKITIYGDSDKEKELLNTITEGFGIGNQRKRN